MNEVLKKVYAVTKYSLNFCEEFELCGRKRELRGHGKGNYFSPKGCVNGIIQRFSVVESQGMTKSRYIGKSCEGLILIIS